jgi:pentapeptide MXKDX repeat protein
MTKRIAILVMAMGMCLGLANRVTTIALAQPQDDKMANDKMKDDKMKDEKMAGDKMGQKKSKKQKKEKMSKDKMDHADKMGEQKN